MMAVGRSSAGSHPLHRGRRRDLRFYQREVPEYDWKAKELGVKELSVLAGDVISCRVTEWDEGLDSLLDELAALVERERRALKRRQEAVNRQEGA
jgi:hypothetical protein